MASPLASGPFRDSGGIPRAAWPRPRPHPTARRSASIGLFVHRPRCHWLSLRPRSPPPLPTPLRSFPGGRGRGGAAQKGGAIGGRDRASCSAPPGPSPQARVSQPQQRPLRGSRTEPRRSNQRLNPRVQVSERCWGAPHLSIPRGPLGLSVSVAPSALTTPGRSVFLPQFPSPSLFLPFPLSLLLCGSGEADWI